MSADVIRFTPSRPLAGATLTLLERSDTGDDVALPSNVSFTFDAGSGQWTLDVGDGLATDAPYYWEADLSLADGGTTGTDGTFTAVGVVTAYAGRYTTRTKCLAFLGDLNLIAYNDVDDNAAEDAGSAQQAIDTAEATVDLRTGGPYTFSSDLNGTIAAGVFEKWARYIACVEMVNKRLPATAETADDERALIYRFRKEAFDEMAQFKAGTLVLPGATPANPTVGESARTAHAPTVAGPNGVAITAAQVRSAACVSRRGGVPFVC